MRKRVVIPIHWNVRQTPLFRLIAFAIALMGGFSGPVLALSHGQVHEHLAQRHGSGRTAEHAKHHDAPARDVPAHHVAAANAPNDDHAHGHLRLDAVPRAQELIRLATAPSVAAMVAAPVTIHDPLHAVRAPARTDRVLLARPDPEQGPPPTLRAPPTL